MSISVNEQMLNIVKRIKEQAKIAEDTFDKRSRELEKSCDSSIDLLGGSATNRVAEIARESKQICDDLYTTYQMLVIMLDKDCRPLLDHKPDVKSVNEVQKTIAWLNSESEIDNNFAASLNKHNLGNLVTVSYYASLENKMIQTFWEQTFRAMPGADEIIKKEEEEEAEKKKRKNNAEKYLKELIMSGGGKTSFSSETSSQESDGNKQVAEALKKIDEKIDEYDRRITKENKRCDEVLGDLRLQLDKCSKEIQDLQTKRKGLGVFKGKEKKTIDVQIQTLRSEVDKIKSEIDLTIQQNNNCIETLKNEKEPYICKRKMVSPKAGDIIEFGTDPLSLQFKPESKISWIVVKITDENIYLFSQKVLACCKYTNRGYDFYNDKALSCLDWLDMFDKKAFNPSEKKVLGKSPLDKYNYAYLYTKTDISQIPKEYLKTSVTETVKKQVDSVERFKDFDKERRIKLLNSSYWLHSYVLCDDFTVHRMKLNDNGKWVAWTDRNVYNDEFRVGMRPAIILNRKKLIEFLQNKA